MLGTPYCRHEELPYATKHGLSSIQKSASEV